MISPVVVADEWQLGLKYGHPDHRSQFNHQRVQSNFTPIVYVRSGCDADTEITCRIGGQLNLGPQEPGTELWFFVDSFSPTSATYRLDITAVVEPGGNCAGNHFQCPTGLTCQRQAGQYRCTSAACSDNEDNDEDGQIAIRTIRAHESPDDTDEETHFCRSAQWLRR